MAVIGTFGQFTTARLAIYASQASLSVTGNNIANINTTGYTRQRMDLVSLYSTGQGKYANIFNTNVGYGVLTRGATQLRDPYLDIRYRNENSKLGANDEKLNSLYQIGNILDEVGKGEDGFGVIEAQFDKFMEALQNDNTNIGSEEYDKLVRSAASILTTYFNKAADDLADIKENKVNELKESISDVNKLLTEIRDLNVQIRTQNIYGDKALELRDARNLALDKLSGYMNIEVTYSMERIDQFSEVEKLTVTIAGSKGPDGKPIKLVDGIYGGQIEMPERMPVLNPNANQKAILDAVQAARDAAMALTDGEVKAAKPNWNDGLDDKIAKAQEREVKKVLDKYGLASEADIDNLDAAEQAKAKADIQTAKDTGTQKATDSALNAAREEIAAVKAEEAKEDAITKFGKYVLDDGTITDDLEQAVTPPNGQFNFDPKDPTKADSLYLMQLGKLVDQRGRVMEEKGNPSGKSEIIAFTDTTFCGNYTNPDGTVHATTALGSIQAIREMLTREGEYSSADDIARDSNANIKRGIPYYERALDNLAKEFAKVFNEMNQISLNVVYDMGKDPVDKDGKPILDANGDPITWDMITETLKDKDGDPITDKDGNEMVVFKQQATAEEAAMIDLVRSQAAKAPGYSFYDGGVLLSNRGDNNDPTGITAANISISDAWGNHTVRMLQTKQKSEVKEDGTEVSHTTERDNIINMIAEFTKKRDFIAKDVQADAHAILPVFHGSFQEVFTAISGVLADDAQATSGKAENYALSTLDLDNSRQSVSGVDLNDEATSMMQFSKSYSAACRLLTTIDSMLDTLINGTAR